jgi:hypothetical protein
MALNNVSYAGSGNRWVHVQARHVHSKRWLKYCIIRTGFCKHVDHTCTSTDNEEVSYETNIHIYNVCLCVLCTEFCVQFCFPYATCSTLLTTLELIVLIIQSEEYPHYAFLTFHQSWLIHACLGFLHDHILTRFPIKILYAVSPVRVTYLARQLTMVSDEWSASCCPRHDALICNTV